MDTRNTRLATLFRQLDAGMSCRLTLLVAPPGAGKSDLLRRWLAARGWPAAWLELDAADNVPARFVQHLAFATQHLLAPSLAPDLLPPDLLASDLLAQDHNPAPDPAGVDGAFAAWLNALADLEGDFCLVLDSYEQIQSAGVHSAVRLMLDHPPPHIHLYIATRTEPPLQLPRLRVRRQLVEMRLE
jgi:LuxR family maltose regulon positive regulatory protein